MLILSAFNTKLHLDTTVSLTFKNILAIQRIQSFGTRKPSVFNVTNHLFQSLQNN
jgi:hypothetical protein